MYSSMVAWMARTEGLQAAPSMRVEGQHHAGSLGDGGDGAQQRVGLKLLEQGLVAVHDRDLEVGELVGLLRGEGEGDAVCGF